MDPDRGWESTDPRARVRGMGSPLLAAVLALASASAADTRQTIAVLDPQVVNLPADASAALGEAIRDMVVNAGKYRVQDRAAMREILAQQKLNASEVCDESCAVEQGRLLQVRYLVSATARKLEGTTRVSIRLTDVESGEVMGAMRGACDCSLNELVGLAEELTRKILAGEKDTGALIAAPAKKAPAPEPEVRRVALVQRLVIHVSDEDDRYELAVRAGEDVFPCARTVSYDQPCVLEGITGGPAVLEAKGAAEFVKSFRIPDGRAKVTIDHAGWTMALVGLGLFGAGVAAGGLFWNSIKDVEVYKPGSEFALVPVSALGVIGGLGVGIIGLTAVGGHVWVHPE